MWFARFGVVVLVFVSGFFLVSAGCSQNNKQGQSSDLKGKPDDGKKGDHSGWWCEGHGVPEHLCSLCSDEVAAKCKKEGDWCNLHDRALSQCFKCDPSKYAKFEAMYEVNFNKKPPRPPEEEFMK